MTNKLPVLIRDTDMCALDRSAFQYLGSSKHVHAVIPGGQVWIHHYGKVWVVVSYHYPVPPNPTQVLSCM